MYLVVKDSPINQNEKVIVAISSDFGLAEKIVNNFLNAEIKEAFFDDASLTFQRTKFSRFYFYNSSAGVMVEVTAHSAEGAWELFGERCGDDYYITNFCIIAKEIVP